MRILITTGIYPPHIGGPAQYAKNLKKAFNTRNVKVKVLTYKFENKLPTGIRHGLFFLRAFFALLQADFCITLDTFSTGLPSVLAGKILGKKIIVRTGGDFLWESYVERTGDLVLFRQFYEKSKNNFSFKEKIVFALTKWMLQNTTVVFSTSWQKDIFEKAYSLSKKKSHLIENYYGSKCADFPFKIKNFIAGTRVLKWKNRERLERAFNEARKKAPEITLDLQNAPYEQFLEKLKGSYAVILVSLGDISPNMILDALCSNKPFILTRETGLYDRLKDVAIFVDPENKEDIAQKIIFLSDERNYQMQKEKIKNFSFTHSWDEIAGEFLKIHAKI